MIPRAAAGTLRKLSRSYPAVAITGPRQSGKTTLARSMFRRKPYVSLEDPDQREFAEQDPRGFLALYPDGATFDEVQRTPQLLSYLQTHIDKDPRPGRYILTGSQQFGLLSGITQTLAGRIALLHLLPFSLGELAPAGRSPAGIEDLLYTGLYPPIHDRRLDPSTWYANYIQTYVERDVRQMINVRDLSAFRRFVRMCAARTGQLLNLSGLANDCGITHNTARAWLSVLEASYVAFLLPPHHRNFNKRMIKTPKLYFYDTGVAASLLGIQSIQQVGTHPMRGPLFETWGVGELMKARFNRSLPSNIFFWRDRSGNEVDVVVDHGDALQAIEMKSGATLAGDYLAGLERWRALAGAVSHRPSLLYAGEEALKRSGVEVFPWRKVNKLIEASAPR